MDINDIQKKINSVNWNFDFTINYDYNMIKPFNCRKYYSYPATFIPEIPYTLIEILTKKGDVVLDPFGGIGTTFMQSLSLERIPYTYDINPIASNVCMSLYNLFNPAVDLNGIRDQLLQWDNEYDENCDYSLLLTEPRLELKGWYELETFNELAYLFSKYDNNKNEEQRYILDLVLPSILATLSSQRKGWAYFADNVKPKEDEYKKKSTFGHFKTAINTLCNDVENQINVLPETYHSFYQTTAENVRVVCDSIVNTDILDETVDLIITSPPYPRMIDYVKSQRLSFYFTELNFREYVEQETGARSKRTRKDTLDEYESQIMEINLKMMKLLKPEGFICLVLPDYKSDDNRKPLIEKIVKWYFDNGFKEVAKIGRYIPSHRRTLSIQWATLVNEHIYIFQKG